VGGPAGSVLSAVVMEFKGDPSSSWAKKRGEAEVGWFLGPLASWISLGEAGRGIL
jgi:hypothetical protein